MITDLEKSFKSLLRAIAKETNRDPADLWQSLILERFLVRLANSNYRDHFVLKGAVLLSKYIDLGRETRDLDLLAKGVSNNVDHLSNIFEGVTQIDLNDGFAFQNVKVSNLTHPHMHYSGAEVSAVVHFGHVKNKLSIDVGFGDLVEPVQRAIPLLKGSKGAIFEQSVNLVCYPKEFIFAEKLETIIYRGATNSRMKDFHDLHSLIASESGVPFHNLREIIQSVFVHRSTPLNLPIEYKASELPQLRALWGGYARGLKNGEKIHSLQFDKLVSIINEWLNHKGFF